MLENHLGETFEEFLKMKTLPNAPKNLIIPMGISNILFDNPNGELNILEVNDQIYGKALHGHTKINFKNGNTYEGHLFNGMFHGQGIYTWVDGVQYIGEFNFNKLTGKGKYLWADGSFYEGDLIDGLRHGYGVYQTNNGDIKYEGEWANGLKEGKGKLSYKSGTVYDGEFLKGLKHGYGKIVYASGNTYEGQWEKDVKEGKGIMSWETLMERYEGNWSRNLQNGFGVHLWLETRGEGKFLRNRYEGEWLDGKRNGIGTFYYANGSKYQGEWIDNKKEGHAFFINEFGELEYGLFSKDRASKLEKLKKEPLIEIKESNLILPMEITEIESPEIIEKEIKEENSNLNNNSNTVSNSSSPKLLKQASVASTDKAILQRKKTKILTSLKKDQQENAKESKKSEIEINPFYRLLDLSDLLIDNQNNDKIMKNITNMLLRHNPLLKRCYKYYSEYLSDKEMDSRNEISFAMNLGKFWKFLKDVKVSNSKTTIAAVQRLLLQGFKNNFELEMNKILLRKKIDLLKSEKKNQLDVFNLSDQDYFIIFLLEDCFSDKKIDYKSADFPENPKNDLKIEALVVHHHKKLILYRQFIELIVRMAYLNSENLEEMHRVLEKIILNKISPLLEEKQKKSKENSIQYSTKSTNDLQKKALKIFENYNAEFANIFKLNLNKNQHLCYLSRDETILVKNFFWLLKKSGLLTSDEEKLSFFHFVEKTFDPEESLTNLENVNNSSISDKREKKTNKEREKERELQITKNKRIASLVESELIFEQYLEILFLFITKKVDSHHNHHKPDPNRDKQILELISKFIKTNSKQKRNPEKFWPVSEKEKILHAKKEEKLRKMMEEKKKKDLEEERKREQDERNLMHSEDLNVNKILDKDEQEELEEEDEMNQEMGSQASFY